MRCPDGQVLAGPDVIGPEPRFLGDQDMATEYDAPRKTDDELAEDSIEEL